MKVKLLDGPAAGHYYDVDPPNTRLVVPLIPKTTLRVNKDGGVDFVDMSMSKATYRLHPYNDTWDRGYGVLETSDEEE